MLCFVKCSSFILTIVFVSRHISFQRNLAQAVVLVAEWIGKYGIHNWMILRSSYKKMAWMGFEPTTYKFCSDALANWATRS